MRNIRRLRNSRPRAPTEEEMERARRSGRSQNQRPSRARSGHRRRSATPPTASAQGLPRVAAIDGSRPRCGANQAHLSLPSSSPPPCDLHSQTWPHMPTERGRHRRGRLESELDHADERHAVTEPGKWCHRRRCRRDNHRYTNHLRPCRCQHRRARFRRCRRQRRPRRST